MRYKDIADVRNRGRREVVSLPKWKIVRGPSRRIENAGFYVAKDGGRIRKAHGAPMQNRWRATIASASHPIARLWREFFDKKIKPINEARKMNKKAPLKAVGPARINAKFPGWKSFKKRANAEGNAKIAIAMAR